MPNIAVYQVRIFNGRCHGRYPDADCGLWKIRIGFQRQSRPESHDHVKRYRLSTTNCVMLRCNMTLNNLNDPTDSNSTANGVAEGEHLVPPPQVYRCKVYRDDNVNGWIVEPPRDRLQSERKMVFTGARSQQQALTYAYEKFGNARFFPY